MTREESTIQSLMCHIEALEETIKALEQEPCEDAISRQAVLDIVNNPLNIRLDEIIKKLPSVTQKSETVTEFADRCRECGAKYGKLLKQEPSGDLISRQAVIEICNEEWDSDLLVERIEQLPSVNPQEPKTDVLDKIRAEIMDFEEELFHRPNTDYTDYAAVRHCVEIIDKYKSESEE